MQIISHQMKTLMSKFKITSDVEYIHSNTVLDCNFQVLLCDFLLLLHYIWEANILLVTLLVTLQIQIINTKFKSTIMNNYDSFFFID